MPCIVVDNIAGNLLKIMHNKMLIWGDNYSLLPEYLEASSHRNNTLEETSFRVVNSKLIDKIMRVLIDYE